RQYVSSGGNATNTTINSAGVQHVSSGGSTTNTTISDG
ncbi:AIDA repeat-containing protein, partial [Escherichia coli]